MRLLGKIERLLGARRQQVIEARAALDRLAQENVRLQRAANHDALTGLHNRRSFDRAMVRECNRASRGQSRVALLMFDVDHFRALNNARGHVYGDECLRLIGGVIADEASRSTDLAARIGGEEFAIVLPGATTAAASERAQQICDAVRARKLEHPASVTSDYVTLASAWLAWSRARTWTRACSRIWPTKRSTTLSAAGEIKSRSPLTRMATTSCVWRAGCTTSRSTWAGIPRLRPDEVTAIAR